MLRRLLSILSNPGNHPDCNFSIVVVDNDKLCSAKSIVSDFANKSELSIRYIAEPEQNIAIARNCAVRNATGRYLAFIDDDEYPGERWLQNLYDTIKKCDVDGVLGPVRPDYEVQPPKWLLKGGLYNRKEFNTGEILRNPRDMRTGNVLFSMRIFERLENPFDPRYGKTGGEDAEFFNRAVKQGKIFAWCNEAPVYETVTPERMNRSYFLKRALLRGVVNAKSQPFNILGVLKSIMALLIYIASLPIMLLAGHHYFMNYLIKSCDHIGKVLSSFGVDVIKERAW